MNPEERIDAALATVLKAAGMNLANYATSSKLPTMREAMRKIMSDSYIQGSNAQLEVMKK